MPTRDGSRADGRSARQARSTAKKLSRADLRLAIEDAVVSVFQRFYPGLSEKEVRRMVRETPAPPRALTDAEIATAGRPIKAKDVRPRRGSRRGRSPGPWVAVALSLDPSEARRWHNIPEDEAKAAQSNVTNKRRRDGKDEQGRWRTPIWVNIAREDTGYRVTIANDPDREAHDAME